MGLHVIDVSNLSSMVEIGSVAIETGPVCCLAVTDGLAYVANRWGKLWAIDVRDSSTPIELGSVEAPVEITPADLASHQGYVYIAAFAIPEGAPYPPTPPGALAVIDARNPSAPVWVQRIRTQREGTGVTISNGYLYYAQRGDGYGPQELRGGVTVFDLSDPAYPMGTGYFLELPDDAAAIAAANGRGYVACNSLGVRVIDMSNPRIPEESGALTPPTGGPFVISNGFAYMVDRSLWIADVSSPDHPVQLSSLEIPGDGVAIAIGGDHLYVAVRDYGLQIIDVSNRSAPVEVGAYSLPAMGDIRDLAAAENYVFVVDHECRLVVVDASDPSSPFEADALSFPGCAVAVDVSGVYAYVATLDSGLRVVDVTTPSAIFEVACCLEPEYIDSVVVSDGYAYSVNFESLFSIIDVRDPTSPVLVSQSLQPPWPLAQILGVSEGYGYLSGWSSPCVSVIDVRDPTSPTRVGLYCGGLSTHIMEGAVSGQRLYVEVGNIGLSALDVQGCRRPWQQPVATTVE
jgi:hypothetical protein